MRRYARQTRRPGRMAIASSPAVRGAAAALLFAAIAAGCGADGGGASGDGQPRSQDTSTAVPGLPDIQRVDGPLLAPDLFFHLGGDDTIAGPDSAPADLLLRDTEDDLPRRGPCTTSGDCPGGLHCCANGGCRFTCGGGSTGCRTDADCDEGERCCADGGCRPDCGGLSPVCNTTHDCPQGEECCEDYHCRPSCETAPPDASCTSDDDCPEPQHCIRVGSIHVCLSTCTSDGDCREGEPCQPFGGLLGQHLDGLPHVCTCASDAVCDEMPCCDFPFGALKTCMLSCPDAGVLGGL